LLLTRCSGAALPGALAPRTAHAGSALASAVTAQLRPLALLRAELIGPGLLLRGQNRPNLGLHRLTELLVLRAVGLHGRARLFTVCACRRRVTTLTRLAGGLHMSAGIGVELLQLRAVALVNRVDLGTLSLAQPQGISQLAAHHVAGLATLACMRALSPLSFCCAGGNGQKSRNRSDTEDLHRTNLQL
jgi:hypothetical protein